MSDKGNEQPELLSTFRFGLVFGNSNAGEVPTGGDLGAAARFSEVSGLELTAELEALKEGGYGGGARQLWKRANPGVLVLKRGLTRDGTFWALAQRCIHGPWPLPYLCGTIFQYFGQEEPESKRLEERSHVAWHFRGAMVSKVVSSPLNAAAGGIAIEELHLAHSGLWQGEERHGPKFAKATLALHAVAGGTTTGKEKKSENKAEKKPPLEKSALFFVQVDFNPDSLKYSATLSDGKGEGAKKSEAQAPKFKLDFEAVFDNTTTILLPTPSDPAPPLTPPFAVPLSPAEQAMADAGVRPRGKSSSRGKPPAPKQEEPKPQSWTDKVDPRDVRIKTDLILKMLPGNYHPPAGNSAGPKGGKAAKSPPPAAHEVVFSWGAIFFRGVLKQANETLELFSPDGVPLRSRLSLSIEGEPSLNPTLGPGKSSLVSASNHGPAAPPPDRSGIPAGPDPSSGFNLPTLPEAPRLPPLPPPPSLPSLSSRNFGLPEGPPAPAVFSNLPRPRITL